MSPTDAAAAASLIRVFLLMEHRLLLGALLRLFRRHSDILVVGQGGQDDLNPRSPVDQQCDVLITDFAELKRREASIESIWPEQCKTILIGMESGEQQFIAAVRSGVTGYLLQDASPSDVVAAVRAVFRGDAVCPSQLCSTLFRLVAQNVGEMPLQNSISKPALTLRQQRLVSLVAKGLTNKEIASHLNLSEFTIRNHIHRILKQLNAGSRSEAVEAIRACGYRIGA